MTLLHSSHAGFARLYPLARHFYFWPNMKEELKQAIAQCEICQIHKYSQNERIQRFKPATKPFQSISMDLFEAAGHKYLVIVDRYSLYTWVYKYRSLTTAEKTLQIVLDLFYEYGYCRHVLSDGGPQFDTTFTETLADLGIIHEKSSPWNSRGNGLAENAVQSMKLLILKTETWEAFKKAHLVWRNTPSSGETISPYEKFHGRRGLCGFPHIAAEPHSFIPDVKVPPKLPPLHHGQRVRIQNWKTGKWDETGVVHQSNATNRSYIILRDHDWRYLRRNRVHLRPIPIDPNHSAEPVQFDDYRAFSPDTLHSREQAWQREQLPFTPTGEQWKTVFNSRPEGKYADSRRRDKLNETLKTAKREADKTSTSTPVPPPPPRRSQRRRQPIQRYIANAITYDSD